MSNCQNSGTRCTRPALTLIMLYAMCGFANFASLGIMIGGLGTWRRTARGDQMRSG